MDKGSKAKSIMTPGLLEQRKRKEVVMTREEAVKKKLPKGYAYEPIPPAKPAMQAQMLEEKDLRKGKADLGKRTAGQVDIHHSMGLSSFGTDEIAGRGVDGSYPSIDIPGKPAWASISRGVPVSAEERDSLRKSFRSELELLNKIVLEIEGRELVLGDSVLSGGSSESRKRMRRTGDDGRAFDISPPAQQIIGGGGRGEVGPGSSLPTLKHSGSFQMSAGDSVGGGQTPKRTPKANSAYINQDFISGQDKIPNQEKAKGTSTSVKKLGSNTNVNGGRVLDLNDPKRQRIEAARLRRVAEALKQCQTVLKKAMTHKYSWVFNTPVDVEGLGLHDYNAIIKKPMDLGTVNQRLKASLYQHPDEFQAEVSLVWSNAMTYNQPGSDVYVMAAELKKVFDEAYKKITMKLQEDAVKREQEEKELREWTPVQEKNEVLDLQRRLQALENQVVAQAAAQKPKARSVAGPPKPKPGDKGKREMTYAEKQKLSMNLGELPGDRLDKVVQIVAQRNPNFANQPGEDIELDIDALDVETLWELDRFLVNYMKSKAKKKSGGHPATSYGQAGTRMVEPQSSKGRDAGEGEDSADVGDGALIGPSGSVVEAHKDALSTKSVASTSSSGSSDDSSSSSGSDSDSGSDSHGDEAQSKSVALKGPGQKDLPGSSLLGGADASSLGTGNVTRAKVGATSATSSAENVGSPTGEGEASAGKSPEEQKTSQSPPRDGETAKAIGGSPDGGGIGWGVLTTNEETKEAPEETKEAPEETKEAPEEAKEVPEPVLDDEAALRRALTRKKYADIILRAKSNAMRGSVADPKLKEEMERQQREEKAKIDAAARAAQEAARRKAEQAAIAARKKREEEREAERRRLLEMESTVEIDENQRVLNDMRMFGASPARTPTHHVEEKAAGLDMGRTPLGFAISGNALGNLGFELAESDEENDEDDAEDVEEGEI